MDRGKRLIQEQAGFAVGAELGWTYHEVEKAKLKAVGEKAVEALRAVRSGICPATMALPAP